MRNSVLENSWNKINVLYILYQLMFILFQAMKMFNGFSLLQYSCFTQELCLIKYFTEHN